MNSSLLTLGLRPSIEASFRSFSNQGLSLGRVAAEHRSSYDVYSADGIVRAELLGRLRHESASRDDLPAVGDWVAFRAAGERGTIHSVLPRSSVLRRGLAGGTTEAQIVAANVDVVFLVTSLDGDLEPRRIERYLTAVHSSGAEAIVVLTKADAANERDALASAIHDVARGARVIVTSSVTGEGVDAVRAAFAGQRTGVLVGSSGVGKSTLANALLTEHALTVGAVDVDGRGRHTTTWRELVVVPSGGILIDTPGMRELRLFGEESDLEQTFDDVIALAGECRFRDCAHEDEPDCAVRDGLDDDRYRSYHKLKRELATLALRKDARAQSEQKRRMKVIARALRARIR